MRLRRCWLLVCVSGSALVLTACGGGAGPSTITSPVSTTPVTISVTPTTATMDQGATQQFNPFVNGTPSSAVTWSVQEGASGGSISTTGLYTAPNAAATFHVIATSVADSSKSAIVTVNVPSVA